MRRSLLRTLGVLVGFSFLLPASLGAASPPEPAAAASARCTKSAAQVLAGLQGLGGQARFTTVRHRGDFDATTPENSLGAFRNSYAACRPGIETDLRHTADGALVMFHDTHVGKMMEPTYVPETGVGPNAALTSLTLAQQRQKRLVTIDRRPSEWGIVTFEEFLADAVAQDGPSLLFVEIKDNDDILTAVRQTLDFHGRNPQARIFDRVVFKIRLNAFPTFASWKQATAAIPGLPRTPLTQVAVSRAIADDVDRRTDLGTPSGRTPSYHATSTWAGADATTDGVLSVEVTMKDSVGFFETTHKKGAANGSAAPAPFRDVEYYAPRVLSEANARPGTMAQLTALVRASGKPLGQFVPVPDWVMWRSGPVDWNRSLPSVVGNAASITPQSAYFQNDSRCCYALEHRLADSGPDPEQNEQRTILPWLQDLGATVLTADDTDSIDFFFDLQGRLYDLGRPVDQTQLLPAPAAMNSLISPAVNEGTRRLSPTMMMVSVRSVRVTDIDRENPGDLYGTIRIHDASTTGRRPLDIRRESARKHYGSHPEVRVDAGGQALFGGGTLDVELWDRDRDASPDDLIAKRTLTLAADTPDGTYSFTTSRGETHDIPGVGTKETYGQTTVVYTVQRYWTNVELLEVRIGSIDGENPGDLFGTIRTSHADHTPGWSSHHFLLNRWEWISIRPNQLVPLHSVDPPGFDLATVTFDLWDADGGSKDDMIAQGPLTIDKHDPIGAPRVRTVSGQYGFVTATTSWNAHTNRRATKPLVHLPVVAADGS